MRRLWWWGAVGILAVSGACGEPGPHHVGIHAGGAGGGGDGGSDAPPLTVVPEAIDFSWVCAGARAREVLTITNRRSQPASVQLQAEAPAVVDPARVDVPPVGEILVGVQLTPPATEKDGPHSGDLVVKTDGGDIAVPWTARVTHDARGRPTALCGSEVPCTNLETGMVQLGDEAEVTFDLVNDGCAGFSVTALLPRRAGGGPAPELRVLDPAVPFPVGPGERRTVRLAFGPTAAGEADGDVVVQTDTPSRDEVRLPWSGSGH